MTQPDEQLGNSETTQTEEISPARLRQKAAQIIDSDKGRLRDIPGLLRQADRLEQVDLWGDTVPVALGGGVPGQDTRIKAQREFDRIVEIDPDAYPWGRVYVQLRDRGYTFREAALIAWKSYDEEHRVPKTQEDMAALLRCSPKTVGRLLAKPQVQAMIEGRLLGPWARQLSRIDNEVIPAVVEVATRPEHRQWPFAVKTALQATERAGAVIVDLGLRIPELDNRIERAWGGDQTEGRESE